MPEFIMPQHFFRIYS